MLNPSRDERLSSLLPFLLFLVLFLGTGLILSWQQVDYAFYQLPASIAIIPAIFLAFVLGQAPVAKQIEHFIAGAGHANIITMCLIYLLAGAFAAIAKSTGSVDASVNVAVAYIPPSLLLPGLFLVTAFIATAMGTSMGTIAAIAPVAAGFIESAGLDAALIAGCIISGAIFGDNLSIISDTTIAATRSQGAHMKDKFKANFFIALPAALGCLLLFTLLSNQNGEVPLASGNINIWAVLPYLSILLLALIGMNVFVVLSIGIVFAALLAAVQGDYGITRMIADINRGFASMQDIFILSLFIGGLSELIKRQGGLAALVRHIESLSRRLNRQQHRASAYGIAALVFICNFFTANNTVTIILAGDTAKQLADDGELTPAQSSSLLDIFACINQGLLPYGAQTLLLGSTLTISPLQIVNHAYYPMLLLLVALLTIRRLRVKRTD